VKGATIAPIVTGHVDPAALDNLLEMFLTGHGLADARGTQPCAAGTLARLRGSLLAMAADVLSARSPPATLTARSPVATTPPVSARSTI
jgi:hypothetical protein